MSKTPIVILSSSPPPQFPSRSSTPLREIPRNTRSFEAAVEIISDDEFPSVQQAKRRKTAVRDDRPVRFSSSPEPFRAAQYAVQGRETLNLSDDPIELESSSPLASPRTLKENTRRPIAPSGKQKAFLTSSLSTETNAFLARLSAQEPASSQPKPKDVEKQSDLTDKTGKKQKAASIAAPKATPRSAVETAAEKDAHKKERDLAKEVAKEAAKAEKQRVREQKAKEKQKAKDLAAVNTLKLDKKKTVLEMTVVFPDSMIDSTRHTQAIEVLRLKGVPTESWKCAEFVVKWKRKVTAEYDATEDVYRDVPETIQEENTVLVIIEADTFCRMLDSTAGNSTQNIETFLTRTRSHLKDYQKLILVIEGLELWRRKHKNALNRAHAAAVRAATSTAPPPSSQRSATGPSLNIDEDTIEDALLSLQIHHKLQMHHTSTPLDTADWIGVFTEQISLARYKRARLLASLESGAGFCIEVGQVKCGNDKEDSYDRSLQEILRVTPAISRGITLMHPNLQTLYNAFLKDGPLAIENVPKLNVLGGGITNTGEGRIGPAISKRMHRIFTSTDPDEYDI